MSVERGVTLARLRKERAMTQQVLADAAGVKVQTVKRAEAGRNLQPETVMALCAVLGTTPMSLPTGNVVTEPPPIPPEVGDVDPVTQPAPEITVSQDATNLMRISARLRSLGAASFRILLPIRTRRVRRGGLVRRNGLAIGMAAIALTLEVVAWSPLVGWEFVFRILQFLAMLCMAASAGEFVSDRWFNDGSKGALNLVRTCCAAMAPTVVVSLTVGGSLLADLKVQRHFTDEVRQESSRYTAMIGRMVAKVPGYDAVTDEFYVRALGWAVMDSSIPPIRSLGAYKAWQTKWKHCQAEWRDAPSYDQQACEKVEVSSTLEKWPALWHSLVGGAFVGGHAEEPVVRAHFADHRFDRVRAPEGGD